MVAAFPRALLRERSHSWNLRGNAMSSGSALGVAPVVRTDGGGFWSCVMTDVSLSGIKGSGLRGRDRQKAATLLWRAVRNLCDGGAKSIVVPRNDALFRPMPAGFVPGQTPFSDGSLFSDGTGFYQPIINIVTTSASLRRATSLAVEIQFASQMQGGESFSINHPNAGWRCYEIATVEQAGNQAVITFRPPLREAVPAGELLEFDEPRCLMRLATSGAMNLTIQPWTFNSASVEFVEATW